MSKRVDAAIAILERVRLSLKGPVIAEIEAALAWLRPSPSAVSMRERRAKERDATVSHVSSQPSSHVSSQVNRATPDLNPVPSQERQRGTRKDPESPPTLSLLSPEDSVQYSTDVRAAVWRAYAYAYQRRYRGVAPTSNAKVRSQVKLFCERVPAEDACGIAAFYVQSNNAFYVSKGHPIGLLLNDAEKLRTEYLAGAQMTATRARELDKATDRESRLEAARARLQAEDDAAALEVDNG